MYSIEHCNACHLFSAAGDLRTVMSDFLAGQIEQYVVQHLDWLRKYDPEIAGDHDQYLALILGGEKIVGYRYFYWDEPNKTVHFFAVGVDEAVRRQGFAIKTFLYALKMIEDTGHNVDYLRICVNSERSTERDGLVGAYRRLAERLYLDKGYTVEVMYQDLGFKIPGPRVLNF